MANLPELIAAIIVPILFFLVLPWMIFHYITLWKKAGTLTKEDEHLLDELHELARRCDERLCTVERIISADNPNWRALACDPADIGIENKEDIVRRIK
jgi:phage shock protein B